ncbi:hypothetical protein GOV08_04295 [Candidatus Woesearchaeota archaeon]|nr:hypothetical protein [Candidatus Woesearchaeota archaeon]
MQYRTRPNTEEIKLHLLSTVKHCSSVIFYLELFGIQVDDPQSPHDIMGLGNKFEWPVMRGMALSGRNSMDDDILREQINLSVSIHRRYQNHHQNSFPDDSHSWLQAIDAVCASREDRIYLNGDSRPYGVDDDPSNPSILSKVKAMIKIHPDKPDLDKIISIHDIPNIGLPSKTHNLIVDISANTVEMLRTVYGYPDL